MCRIVKHDKGLKKWFVFLLIAVSIFIAVFFCIKKKEKMGFASDTAILTI